MGPRSSTAASRWPRSSATACSRTASASRGTSRRRSRARPTWPTCRPSASPTSRPPADQWDALPSAAKLQILVFIGFLEMWSETSTVLKLDGEAHYVRGGKPGYFPKLSRKDDAAFPHPVPLNLWDPFGFTSKMSPERKEKALLAEINNGRLAQIGVIGMISASKGLQVPGLDSIAGIKPYAGEVMAPFATGDATLPFVADMLKSVGSYGW